MRTLYLVLVAAFVAWSLPLHAQVTPPTVVPLPFGVGNYAINLDSTDAIDVPSNGLANVAPNTKVYVMPTGAFSEDAPGGDGAAWASATWTFTEVPSGSAAAFTMIDAYRACFVPDMEGTYKIECTATDDQGESATGELVVNVAMYVGVGKFADDDATPPKCYNCHKAKSDTWIMTPHATAAMRKLDDETGHFGEHCMSCHVTGATDANEMGNGFLMLAKSSSWEFPTELKEGNWDELVAEDVALAGLATISCENCHGPGSGHMGATGDNKITTRVTEDACLQCHDAPTHHVFPYEWRFSGHSISIGEPDDPWHMNRGSQTSENSDCARCHTSAGYLDVVNSGKPYAESFTNAPYDDPGNVGCPTCHNPHDATNEHQLRFPAQDLCATCHHIRVSGHSGLHASHQGSMVAGVDGKEFPGYTYRNSGHTYMEEGCAGCHMAAPVDAAYKDFIGGHTFNILYDNGTPDDKSDDILNTTSCVECHGEHGDLEYVEEIQEHIKELLDELKAIIDIKRPDGTPVYPSDDTLNTHQADIHFNWYFVNNDNSFGVHNRKYAEDLLLATIQEAILEYGPNSVSSIGEATSYALNQNYPNPFNPSTTIEFAVPQGSDVKVNIYDANGQLVYKLVNGYYPAGTYTADWNGTIYDANTVAPSGVYFYSIQAGDYSATKKMVLMK